MVSYVLACKCRVHKTGYSPDIVFRPPANTKTPRLAVTPTTESGTLGGQHWSLHLIQGDEGPSQLCLGWGGPEHKHLVTRHNRRKSDFSPQFGHSPPSLDLGWLLKGRAGKWGEAEGRQALGRRVGSMGLRPLLRADLLHESSLLTTLRLHPWEPLTLMLVPRTTEMIFLVVRRQPPAILW